MAIFGLADAPKITIIVHRHLLSDGARGPQHHAPGRRSAAPRRTNTRREPRQLLTHIVLPSALPNLYRDMRILVGWAWTYLVVAELIGEKSGISAFIYQQQRYRKSPNVYASIVIIGAIGPLARPGPRRARSATCSPGRAVTRAFAKTFKRLFARKRPRPQCEDGRARGEQMSIEKPRTPQLSRTERTASAPYFEELKSRPVVLEIDKVGKYFDSPKGRITAISEISFSVHRKSS